MKNFFFKFSLFIYDFFNDSYNQMRFDWLPEKGHNVN